MKLERLAKHKIAHRILGVDKEIQKAKFLGPGGGGLDAAAINAQWLRLDTTNDPLTGDLDLGTHNLTVNTLNYTTLNPAIDLSGYVPYTGATADVDLGAYNLTLSGYIGLESNAEMRFYDNGNFVGFEAPALDANQIWVLPTADGAANEFLQTAGDGTLSWAAAGGQTLYDAIVAPSGGDYTSVVTACATEAAGASIFIRTGTYVETADIVMKNGQKLIGENKYDTIIDFDNAAYQILATNLTEIGIENLTIKNSTDTSGHLTLNGTTYSWVFNCRFLCGATRVHGIYYTGDYCKIENCYFKDFTYNTYTLRVGSKNKVLGNSFYNCYQAVSASNECQVAGNLFSVIGSFGIRVSNYSQVIGNSISMSSSSQKGIIVNGVNVTISGNFTTGRIEVSYDYATIVGNSIQGQFIGNANEATLIGNWFYAIAYITGTYDGWTISGNVFETSAYLSIYADSNYHCITGNNFSQSTAATKIVDAGIANLIKNNLGVDSLIEKDFRKMKNTSGGALVAGDVVVLKSVAAGDEVTTTVAQGDDKVFGMLEENIADNAYGYIQILGKTVRLKVDGTDDIVIGDFIGTFTTAGIACKAGAGDMVFAIALEAYTTDDSNGVIDALLISPILGVDLDLLDTQYLKLDCSNDPLTGDLDLTGNIAVTGTGLIGGAADAIQLIVRGNASQAANLQEWQDSTPSVLASVDASGNFFVSDNLSFQFRQNTEYINSDNADYLDLHSAKDTRITCGANYTLELQTSVYEDLQFQISYAKVTPASLLPSWEAFTVNTSEYAFSVNDEVDTQANELPHWWKQGTAGHAHIHITTKAANATGSNRFAKFTVTFAYADIDEVWVEAPLTAEYTIPTGTLALTHLYLDLGNLTFTNYIVGTQIRCRVKRIVATGGTEYAGDIFITQVGIHLERDTLGSRQEIIK